MATKRITTKSGLSVKVKRLTANAVLPEKKTEGAACFDIVANETVAIRNLNADDKATRVHTGLAFEIPEGYVGLLFPRSSNSKKDLTLTNSVGIIDSHFRGEVTLRYKVDATYDRIVSEFSNKIVLEDEGGDQFTQLIYDIGDRVGQLIIMPYPKIKFNEVEDLSETDRGNKGFGSTGH